jgi:hypothetical protein
MPSTDTSTNRQQGPARAIDYYNDGVDAFQPGTCICLNPEADVRIPEPATNAAYPPLRSTLIKGAQLGVVASLGMPILLDVALLLPRLVQGNMDDEILGIMQLVLLLETALTIVPLGVGGALHALLIRGLASRGRMQLRLVLLVGLCAGAIWGLLFYSYTVSASSQRWGYDWGWLIQLQIICVLTYCWHGWRMAAYVERQSVAIPSPAIEMPAEMESALKTH